MSKQKDKFIELLDELFQFNQPELDFGLYRILHAAAPLRLETGATGQPELVIQFDYRPDPEKTGQSDTWQQKRLAEAEQAVRERLPAFAAGHPQARAFGMWEDA